MIQGHNLKKTIDALIIIQEKNRNENRVYLFIFRIRGDLEPTLLLPLIRPIMMGNCLRALRKPFFLAKNQRFTRRGCRERLVDSSGCST